MSLTLCFSEPVDASTCQGEDEHLSLSNYPKLVRYRNATAALALLPSELGPTYTTLQIVAVRSYVT
jgi:hypothetical protein